MTNLEQQLTDHLRRRAEAATPRTDLVGVEESARMVALVDLDEGRPRRGPLRTAIGLAAAIVVVAALAGWAIAALRDASRDETVPATGSSPTGAGTLPATGSSPTSAGTVPPTAPPAVPERRQGGEVIVFESRGPGAGWDLAAQDPETGDARRLVDLDGIVDCPDAAHCGNFVRAAEWSADGRWVAFTVSNTNLDGAPLGPCEATTGVWVKSALGDPRQLTTPCASYPSSRPQLSTWSTAGARLAYSLAIDATTDELFVVDPSDGSPTSLGRVGGPLTALAWSPDGTRIVYADRNSVNGVSTDGKGRSLLSDAFDNIIKVAWSPDGSKLLVHDQGRYRIRVMDPDGTDLHPVLEGKDACCSTTWSPLSVRLT